MSPNGSRRVSRRPRRAPEGRVEVRRGLLEAPRRFLEAPGGSPKGPGGPSEAREGFPEGLLEAPGRPPEAPRVLPEAPGVSPTVPGVLPEAPCERSWCTLGVLVDALLMLVGLSWGASGRDGELLARLFCSLYSRVVLVCALDGLLSAFGMLLDAHETL